MSDLYARVAPDGNLMRPARQVELVNALVELDDIPLAEIAKKAGERQHQAGALSELRDVVLLAAQASSLDELRDALVARLALRVGR